MLKLCEITAQELHPTTRTTTTTTTKDQPSATTTSTTVLSFHTSTLSLSLDDGILDLN
jgi:hypothetical protein